MLTLLFSGSLLLIFAIFIEKNTATCLVVIGAETMLLLNFSALMLTGVPAFLMSLIGASISVLLIDHFTGE